MRSSWRLLILMSAALFVALGSTAGCDDGGNDIGSGDGDADSDTDGDTDSDWSEVAQCTDICSTAADCAGDSSALFEEDNYQCDADGHCRYLGCNSDQECLDAMGDEYGCSTDPGNSPFPWCVKTCVESTDCEEEYGIGAFNHDNYECISGGYCKYLGCHDTGECFETHGTDDYLCLPDQYMGIDTCQRKCATPDDCDLGAGSAKDADNYLCIDQACIYTGCISTWECENTTGFGDGWECVEPA